MTLAYVLSQIFTIAAYSCFGLSFLVHSRKKIVVVNFVGVVLNAVAFIFLGAWTGLAMSTISALRSLYSMFTEKGEAPKLEYSRRDYIVLAIVFLATILASIPTFDGFYCIVPVFGSLLFNYSIWQKDPLVFKALGIPVSLLWVIYNFCIGSFFGVLLEAVLLVASTYGFTTAMKSLKKAKHGKTQSDN
jgi:hypothetical protein